MEILFTIIGFIILGAIVRSLANDKTAEAKPENNSEWIVQLIICLVIGAIVWSLIPESCKHRKDSDYDPASHEKLSPDYKE